MNEKLINFNSFILSKILFENLELNPYTDQFQQLDKLKHNSIILSAGKLLDFAPDLLLIDNHAVEPKLPVGYNVNCDDDFNKRKMELLLSVLDIKSYHRENIKLYHFYEKEYRNRLNPLIRGIHYDIEAITYSKKILLLIIKFLAYMVFDLFDDKNYTSTSKSIKEFLHSNKNKLDYINKSICDITGLNTNGVPIQDIFRTVDKKEALFILEENIGLIKIIAFGIGYDFLNIKIERIIK